jgi:drug/metabolite transporter (DMT)-like permease
VTRQSRAEAALLGTTLIWGGTFVAQKIGLQEISPVFFIAVRFTVAALFFLVLFGRRIFPIPGGAALKGCVLGLFLFLGFLSQTIGLQYTTASKSAFITGMMVIFTPLLQFVIERKAPNLGNILGVAMAATGLWFLTSPGGSAFNVGDALTIICAFVFGVYIVYLDVISREMTTLQLTFLQTASVACFSLVGAAAFEDVVLVLSASSLVTLLYLTLLATVLTTYVQTRFQKDTTPTRAVVIFTIEPVFASVSAYFILNEHIGELGILGGGMIVGGVLVSELSDSIPLLKKSFNPSG